MAPFISEPVFDDHSEGELAEHGLTIEQVIQILEEKPKFFRQKNGRIRAVGPDRSGRMLSVIFEDPTDRGSAYVVTGWPSDKEEIARYGHPGGREND